MKQSLTAPHLAANADLRLQFGKLLLVHYRFLHLTQHKNITQEHALHVHSHDRLCMYEY